jgi:hypothetical protein
LLLGYGLALTGYYIEIGAVLFDDVLGTDIPVDLLGLVSVSQHLSSTGVLVGMTNRVVAESE